MVDITNFSQRAIALLAGQFQNTPTPTENTNLQNLIIALCEPATEIQTQIQNLINDRWINTAVGVQLDGLGEILGLARTPGQSDDSYRQALIFQIQLNVSSGTPEQVINALSFFTNGSKVKYVEMAPAAYLLETNAPATSFPIPQGSLATAIQKLSPAGVEFAGLIATYDNLTFSFSSDAENNPFFVVPSTSDLQTSTQLELSSGDYLYVDGGAFLNPQLGGTFGETGYTDYACPGAGRMAEVIAPI
jgi:hypothetical protein